MLPRYSPLPGACAETRDPEWRFMSESVTGSMDVDAQCLRRTTQIIEEIKGVVRICEGINLTAINAMLVAKRAGEHSRGFGVVSGELRFFSRQLEERMSETTALVSHLARDAAATLNQRRLQQQMERAAGASERSAKLLNTAMEHKVHALSETRGKIRALEDALSRQVTDAIKLCHTGIALGRSAKIEAVYGGSMEATLGQVSHEVEDRMLELLNRLKSLSTDIQTGKCDSAISDGRTERT